MTNHSLRPGGWGAWGIGEPTRGTKNTFFIASGLPADLLPLCCWRNPQGRKREGRLKSGAPGVCLQRWISAAACPPQRQPTPHKPPPCPCCQLTDSSRTSRNCAGAPAKPLAVGGDVSEERAGAWGSGKGLVLLQEQSLDEADGLLSKSCFPRSVMHNLFFALGTPF